VRRAVGYRDAVVLLGGDPPAVAALDRALGGALSVATGGVSGAVLSVFDAQGRIIRLGRDLVAGLRGRLRGAGRADRMQRLEAAHAVIVVTAYFECLATAPLPFAVEDLKITRQQQIALAGGDSPAQGFLDALLAAPPLSTGSGMPCARQRPAGIRSCMRSWRWRCRSSGSGRARLSIRPPGRMSAGRWPGSNRCWRHCRRQFRPLIARRPCARHTGRCCACRSC